MQNICHQMSCTCIRLFKGCRERLLEIGSRFRFHTAPSQMEGFTVEILPQILTAVSITSTHLPGIAVHDVEHNAKDK